MQSVIVMHTKGISNQLNNKSNFSLFILLQSGSLFAQFEDRYVGYYKSDEESYCYIAKYTEDDFGYLGLTEDQKKNCAFAFAVSFRNDEYAGGNCVVKKGSTYVAEATEYLPQLTFSFRSESDTIRKVEITEKSSGKKTILTQYTPPVESYDTEYTDSDYYGYSDEEQPIGEEEMEFDSGLDIRGYSRSDGAELVMIFSEESVVFSVHVPPTKTCSEVMIEGVFDSPMLVDNAYTFTNQELAYTLEVKGTDTGWQLKCLKQMRNLERSIYGQ